MLNGAATYTNFIVFGSTALEYVYHYTTDAAAEKKTKKTSLNVKLIKTVTNLIYPVTINTTLTLRSILQFVFTLLTTSSYSEY